jgi:hypothetical protein
MMLTPATNLRIVALRNSTLSPPPASISLAVTDSDAPFPPPPPLPPALTAPGVWTPIAIVLLCVELAMTALEYGADSGLFSSYVLGAVIANLGIVAIAYGIAFLIARPPTRRRKATITAVVVLGIILLPRCAGITRTAASSGPLTDAERTGLEVTPAGIHHPVLGFSAPHPGKDFVLDTSPAAQAMDSAAAARRVTMRNWVFSQPDAPGVALLQLMSGPRMNETVFRNFANGMRASARDAAVARVLADTLIWTTERKELRFTMRHEPTNMLVMWRCLPSTPAHARQFIICAMRSDMDTTGLAAFTDGLTVSSPR